MLIERDAIHTLRIGVPAGLEISISEPVPGREVERLGFVVPEAEVRLHGLLEDRDRFV